MREGDVEDADRERSQIIDAIEEAAIWRCRKPHRRETECSSSLNNTPRLPSLIIIAVVRDAALFILPGVSKLTLSNSRLPNPITTPLAWTLSELTEDKQDSVDANMEVEGSPLDESLGTGENTSHSVQFGSRHDRSAGGGFCSRVIHR